ncbi:MAG: hypothetical protein AAFQ52_02405 [Chloroflexota bacterium]
MIHADFLSGLASHLSEHYDFTQVVLQHVTTDGDVHFFTARSPDNIYTVRWLPIGMNSYRLEQSLPAWAVVAQAEASLLPTLLSTCKGALSRVYAFGVCIVYEVWETDWHLTQMDALAVGRIADLHAVCPRVTIHQETFELPYADTYLGHLRDIVGRQFADPIRQAMRYLLDDQHENIQFLWRRFRILEVQCQWDVDDFVLTHGNPLASLSFSERRLGFAEGDTLMFAPAERDLWRSLLSDRRAQVVRWYQAQMPAYEVNELACQYYALRDYFVQIDYWVDSVLYVSDVRARWHNLDALQNVFATALPLVARM